MTQIYGGSRSQIVFEVLTFEPPALLPCHAPTRRLGLSQSHIVAAMVVHQETFADPVAGDISIGLMDCLETDMVKQYFPQGNVSGIFPIEG